MTLSPTVPRFSDSAAECASASRESEMPKLSLAFCVPAIDWKTRSSGTPASIARIWFVTCVSTHDCVGISSRWISSSSARHSRANTAARRPRD